MSMRSMKSIYFFIHSNQICDISWYFLTGHCSHCSSENKLNNMWKVKKKKKKTLGKSAIFDSKSASVKQSLVFQKVFMIYEKKNIYPWAKMFIGTQESEESKSGLWFFEGTLSSPAFSKGSVNEQSWITQPSIPRLFLSIFLGKTESQVIFSQAIFYFQTNIS